MITLVERVGAGHDYQRWIAHGSDGVPRIAHVLADDHDWLVQVATDVGPWRTFRHPRVTSLLELELSRDRLIALVDNDRGPQFTLAAQQLAPRDRERWAIAQIIALCDGLGDMAAHQPGYVFGRVDEDHVFVDASGRARFGPPLWSRRTIEHRPGRLGAGRVFGTPLYMSPEQAKGTPMTAASDVFSLAGVLVKAITGRPPFPDTDGAMQILMSIVQGQREPFASSIAGVTAVIDKAFAPLVKDRFATPRDFGSALYECVPDAGDFDQVVSDQIALWWPTAPQAWSDDQIFASRCAKRWEELDRRAHSPDDVRDCSTCNQPVVRIRTLEEVLPLARGACIAFKPSA